jgi:hypothetical protein
LAWKDSASAIQNYKYDVMRKKINVDAIREKYNRKRPLPDGHRSRCNTPLAKKRRRKSNQAHPTPHEDDSNQPSPETEAERRLQEEYLAFLPSTSLAKTTPAFVKKSLQKKAKVNAPHTIHEEQIKSENRQFSYLDATIEDEADRRRRTLSPCLAGAAACRQGLFGPAGLFEEERGPSLISALGVCYSRLGVVSF